GKAGPYRGLRSTDLRSLWFTELRSLSGRRPHTPYLSRLLTLRSLNRSNTTRQVEQKGVGANAGMGQSAVGRARRPHGSGDGAGGCDTLGPAQRRHPQCKANLTICQPFDWRSEKITHLPKIPGVRCLRLRLVEGRSRAVDHLNRTFEFCANAPGIARSGAR